MPKITPSQPGDYSDRLLSGAQAESAFVAGLVHTQAESAADVEQFVAQAIGGSNLGTGQGPNQGYLMFNAGFP